MRVPERGREAREDVAVVVDQVVLTANRTGIQSITTVYNHSEGFVSMEVGPDHALYFSDSNAIYMLALV